MNYRFILFAFTGFTAATGLYAQNNTSPYSIIGIGDIESSYFDRSAGMADAGISLFSGKFQYHANPASYSRLDDHYFHVEMSGRFKGVSYKGNPVQNVGSSSDLQMEKLTMALKIKPWWGVGLGLTPFSSSNYSFYSPKNIQGTTQSVDGYYTGTGGLHKAYFANSFKPFKNFSAGVELSYLWGSLAQEENLGTTSVSGGALTTKRNYYLNKLYLKYGLLYNAKLSNKWRVSLGAAASAKTTLDADYSLTVTDGTQTIVNDSSYKRGYFTLPSIYTVGGSLNYNNKFTLAVDYQAQNWSSLNYKGLGYSLVSSDKLSAGFEYSDKLNNIFERYFVQGGYYFSNSYLRINGQQLTDKGFTVGIGLNPYRNQQVTQQLSYQLNFQFGSRGTIQNNLIKENYTQISFSIIYRDLWFRRKYN